MNAGNIAIIVAASIFFIVMLGLFVGPIRRFFKSMMGLEEEVTYMVRRADPNLYNFTKREVNDLYKYALAKHGVTPREVSIQLNKMGDSVGLQTREEFLKKFISAADLAERTKSLERMVQDRPQIKTVRPKRRKNGNPHWTTGKV